jgi:hypothetical protein
LNAPGAEAIRTLAAAAQREDPAASSHWREQHARFRFTGDGFEGLQGFGGASTRRGHTDFAHRMLQRPFRALAANLRSFGALHRLADRVCASQGRTLDLDVLRNVLTLAFLQEREPARFGADRTACVIGDGFGTLASLLLGSGSAGRVVLVNLSRTLLVDLWYLKLCLGAEAFGRQTVLVSGAGDLAAALARPPAEGGPAVVAVQAADHELLRHCPLDVAFNIVSMGEMDPAVTEAYFADLRAVAAAQPGRELAFYCCNREEKTLPDGTVTRFADYPWREEDDALVDELCPWHQRYYAFRPPFYFPYDGPIRHRLAILAPAGT